MNLGKLLADNKVSHYRTAVLNLCTNVNPHNAEFKSSQAKPNMHIDGWLPPLTCYNTQNNPEWHVVIVHQH